MNIKLPGKEKHKKILLIFLIVLSVVILVYEYGINIKKNKIKNENNLLEEQVIGQTDNDSSLNNDDKNEDTEKDSDSKQYSNEEQEIYNEAYELFFAKEYVDSIKKSDELINRFPHNNMGYNIRGIAKAYNGDYEGGMSDINKSLEIDSNYGYALFNKALTYELYNNMDDALIWYNKALQIEDYVWSYYGIASIYGRRGDVPNTMKYLNKAIEIDNAVKEVAKTEEDFSPVRNSEEFQKAING